MKAEKWITVKEYAKKEGIKLAGAYKRIAENRVTSERKFGKLVVKVS